MPAYRLITVEPPGGDVLEAISAGLREHAVPYADGPGFQTIGVVMRNDAGALVGGACGHINWNWLHIGLVWVAEPLRRGGHGRRLIEAFEQVGRERGCRYAHLDTFSYQARPFYERLGYEVFATLDDYPPGHRRFYLKKAL